MKRSVHSSLLQAKLPEREAFSRHSETHLYCKHRVNFWHSVRQYVFAKVELRRLRCHGKHRAKLNILVQKVELEFLSKIFNFIEEETIYNQNSIYNLQLNQSVYSSVCYDAHLGFRTSMSYSSQTSV